MGSFSIWHWIIVLVVVVVVFGTSKLRNVGKDLGEGIKGFKEGLKGDEKPGQLGSEKREDAAEAAREEARRKDG
ncbi:Sec-independent protein translocase subunit TatA [Arenimonas composti]|uniref:Sec-independent protein translocase protein TatA n=1 Tax=Arenimonas composti TR7-09 = DSM 18010 TaxID=1121013 RepID=A0A091BDG1_9GAMM|nr:Sec-independent protein translocase subunit TatA [Arenimonas composti]KFN49547.1 hypothetical protein P873_10360 [Arenimonas composti TR7-09 = DSM 18010]